MGTAKLVIEISSFSQMGRKKEDYKSLESINRDEFDFVGGVLLKFKTKIIGNRDIYITKFEGVYFLEEGNSLIELAPSTISLQVLRYRITKYLKGINDKKVSI